MSMQALIEENHTHLVTLGVSHPSLEHVRRVTKEYGLSTKLTGAGGGGCAVTLVPDGEHLRFLLGVLFMDMDGNTLGISGSELSLLESSLRDQGYVPYRTEVGGPGLGILLANVAPSPPITPPESPVLSEDCTSAHDREALEVLLSQKPKEDLDSWINGLGPWAYVTSDS